MGGQGTRAGLCVKVPGLDSVSGYQGWTLCQGTRSGLCVRVPGLDSVSGSQGWTLCQGTRAGLCVKVPGSTRLLCSRTARPPTAPQLQVTPNPVEPSLAPQPSGQRRRWVEGSSNWLVGTQGRGMVSIPAVHRFSKGVLVSKREKCHESEELPGWREPVIFGISGICNISPESCSR